MNIVKTKRVKIVTGLKCNIKCIFCYYRDNLQVPNKTGTAILADLTYAYRHGIREVDFSGGEPTIHPDLPRLIAAAKQMGMERTCIITNGWRLAERVYLQELKSAGLDEILFSVHGSSAQIHDQHTAVDGSFERICRAMGNAVDCGVAVRTNTVVTRLNLNDLSAVSRFVADFAPVQVNFITINDWCYAKHLVDALMVRYSEMAPRLKEACDLLESKAAAINVRYIPFCFMQGYERFVCNHPQVMYDPYEWVPHVRTRLEEGTSLRRYLSILAYGLIRGGALRHLGRMSVADMLDEAVIAGLKKWFYTKRSDCGRCRYSGLCDGVENTYAQEFGLEELQVVTGVKVIDPVEYRKVNRAWCVN